MTTPPRGDAAPLAGGAGVTNHEEHPKPTAASVRLRAPARRNAPTGTSEPAARRIEGGAGTLRERILGYLRGRGPDGATDDEAETALCIKPQTYTPRRHELVTLGLVIDSGRRRRTASGRHAAVWIAAEHADRPEAGAEGGRA
jgi:hypothetical protein